MLMSAVSTMEAVSFAAPTQSHLTTALVGQATDSQLTNTSVKMTMNVLGEITLAQVGH